jgi:hypothetical protein
LKISARVGLRLPERHRQQRRDFVQHGLHAATDPPQALVHRLVTACFRLVDGAGNVARKNALWDFIPGNKFFLAWQIFFTFTCLE